jgi:hypothetical protein
LKLKLKLILKLLLPLLLVHEQDDSDKALP